jgi:hypothetical protein
MSPTTRSVLACGLLLGSAARAQWNDPQSSSSSGFSYVQPLNTTILGQYGHSPAVYPSRTSRCNVAFAMTPSSVVLLDGHGADMFP